jgi:hypothetical protein
MERSEETFHFQVRPLGSHRLVAPSRDELIALVPPGSRWTPALGWSGYFGWPLEAAGRHFWALGAEEVRARPAGGAYPVVRVYLHTAPPVAALEALAASLAPARDGAADPLAPGVLVFPISAPTPEASAPDQAAILRHTAAACAARATPLFRTAVLSEPEVLPLAALPGRFPRGVDRCLLGVPDLLARTFAPTTRALLYLRAFWRPR